MISDANKRIARNTVLLYVRLLFSQIIALYTSRKILEVLGIEDFGIQSVVGGVVGMLTFINGSMAVATGRYLSIELGKKDYEGYNRLFSMAVMIHLLLGLTIVVAAQTIGVWILNDKLVIPDNRMFAANCVYQMAVITVFIGIIQTPYMASITSHEHMSIYAYIGMGHSVVYLMIVIALSYVENFDNLVLLSALMMIVGIIEAVIYRMYCIRQFPHCRFRRYWNKGTFKEMLGFTGWNMFGTIAATLKWSGMDLILNLFGGPVANAAAGVAGKVNNAISGLVGGFSAAMNPQITKTYGAGDMGRMHRLLMTGSKLQCLILAILAVPVSIEIEILLDLWLVEVPPYTVWFLRLIVIESLIFTFCNPVITALLATGRIKWYQIFTGTTMMIFLPLAYLALRLGAPLNGVYIASIATCVIGHCVRLVFAHRMLHLPIRNYITSSVLPVFAVLALSFTVTWMVYHSLEMGIGRLMLDLVVGSGSVVLFSYFIGLNGAEREMVTNMVTGAIKNSPLKQLLTWRRKRQLG